MLLAVLDWSNCSRMSAPDVGSPGVGVLGIGVFDVGVLGVSAFGAGASDVGAWAMLIVDSSLAPRLIRIISSI
jgi:hypothetical protein